MKAPEVVVEAGDLLGESPVWDDRGDALWWVDIYGRSLHRWAVHTGHSAWPMPQQRSLFARLDDTVGMPDGATIDADGCLWVVGGRVLRYTPTGQLDLTIALPVSQPTSCQFGGDGLARLFVTSARMRLDDAALAREPLAGSVLALDLGIAGLPVPRYRYGVHA